MKKWTGLQIYFEIIFFVSVYAEQPIIIKNKYGVVLNQYPDYLKGAVVEKCLLYAQKNFDTQETIERRGILIRYPRAQATIVICHGFMCDKFDAGFLRQMFPRGPYNFLTFDFRAHGEQREDQRCTFGRDEALDVIAAAKFIEHHPMIHHTKKFLYGFSMGAVSAIEAVKYIAEKSEQETGKMEQLFDAMVLDCPFDSSKNVIKHNLDNVKFSFFGYEFNIPGRWLLQKYVFHPYVQSLVKIILKTVAHMDHKNINTYICPIHPADSVKKIVVPSLFIHCKNDEKISLNSIRSVFDNAGSQYKILWITNGRWHFDSYFYNPEKYKERITTFFEQALQGLLQNRTHIEIIEDAADILHNDT